MELLQHLNLQEPELRAQQIRIFQHDIINKDMQIIITAWERQEFKVKMQFLKNMF